ncbi:short-chain dehydrogenase/reductase SDR [Catenulispora acidiphila DSM 44928]|uniref:Short-chain dehydrogenase/reductase SDR n=2 Tax=Catenulispora TaxID=414878 RepID=C7PVK0_CATAD|nr:SDR family NAD(P)-dependent oxidoreductase [Catenulispora acidiphila]ACU69356.1 short-chain dehydrogenase/reductase SDR [Catenulispora acidiphila DSM 44928]
MPTAVVIGVGPGLGMSIARRFGGAGHSVALVSRSDARHADYLAELASAGIESEAFVADVNDREQVGSVVDAIEAKHGIDVLYYGPGASDVSQPAPITETTADEVRASMGVVYAAVDIVGRVLPGMMARGRGGLLFAGGLSAVVPVPSLGALAVTSAALRNYALTLNAGLADTGVYAGTLIIGGLIERGDIHGFVVAHPEMFGHVPLRTLNPDDIAAAAWEMYAARDRAEETFSVLS